MPDLVCLVCEMLTNVHCCLYVVGWCTAASALLWKDRWCSDLSYVHEWTALLTQQCCHMQRNLSTDMLGRAQMSGTAERHSGQCSPGEPSFPPLPCLCWQKKPCVKTKFTKTLCRWASLCSHPFLLKISIIMKDVWTMLSETKIPCEIPLLIYFVSKICQKLKYLLDRSESSLPCLAPFDIIYVKITCAVYLK